MNYILDTNILYYLIPNPRNPLNPERLFNELKLLNQVHMNQENFSEFLLSEHLTKKEKIIIINKLKCLNFFIENIDQSGMLDFLDEQIKHLKSFFFACKTKELKRSKIKREWEVLIEICESLVGIFNLYLNYENPLPAGQPSLIFIQQTDALFKGNHGFTDQNLSNFINNQYNTGKSKDFRNNFMDYVFNMAYISMHIFSASRIGVTLNEIISQKNKINNFNNYETFLKTHSCFSKLEDILNKRAKDSKLPIGIGKNQKFLNSALQFYEQYLINQHSYPVAYAKNICLVFRNIFINGSKIDKNDIIDNLLFLYLQHYDILTCEKKILSQLSQIDHIAYNKTKNFLKKVSI